MPGQSKDRPISPVARLSSAARHRHSTGTSLGRMLAALERLNMQGGVLECLITQHEGPHMCFEAL
jgi:hypothetical protein